MTLLAPVLTAEAKHLCCSVGGRQVIVNMEQIERMASVIYFFSVLVGRVTPFLTKIRFNGIQLEI